MNEEEKIIEISKRIGYKVGTYCNDEEIEVFEKFLENYKYKSNLIEKQKAEIENKDIALRECERNLIEERQNRIKEDKIINLMANHIATSDSNLCQYLDMTTKCKYYAGDNGKLCDNCIKQYYEKKVEEDK